MDEYNAVQMHYENMGEAANAFAPHLIQGFPYDRDNGAEERYQLPIGEEAGRVSGDNSTNERSFAYHYDTVKVRYSDLNPDLLYWVRVTYLQERGGQRIQNLDVDGSILHDAIEIPQVTARIDTFVLPQGTYADGVIELNFNRLAGPNAVVSEVSIMEAHPPDESLANGIARTVQPFEALPGLINRVGAEPVVIDGNLNEWPLIYPLLPQTKTDFFQPIQLDEPTSIDSSTNAPVALYGQWDEENLYIAAIINRKVPIPTEETTFKTEASGNREALHLFIDTQLTRSPGMYRSGDHHFVLLISDSSGRKPTIRPSQRHHHLDAIRQNIDPHPEIDVAAEPTLTGYRLEARIPKGLVLNDYNPAAGRSIGFNFIMENVTLSDNRRHRLAYSTGEVNAAPNKWHTLDFVHPVSGQVAFMNQTATQKKDSVNAGETLTLAVWDTDQNGDPYVSESVLVTVKNQTTGQTMDVTLLECAHDAFTDDDPNNNTAPDSGFFAAQLRTEFRRAVGASGELGMMEQGLVGDEDSNFRPSRCGYAVMTI